MPSIAMLRLLMTDWSACALRLASTSATSAVTETSITIPKSATDTIISTSVNPACESDRIDYCTEICPFEETMMLF